MKKKWERPVLLGISALPEALGDCVGGTTPDGAEGGCHDGQSTSASPCTGGSYDTVSHRCHNGDIAGQSLCVLGSLVAQFNCTGGSYGLPDCTVGDMGSV